MEMSMASLRTEGECGWSIQEEIGVIVQGRDDCTLVQEGGNGNGEKWTV